MKFPLSISSPTILVVARLIPEFAKTFVIEAGSSFSWYKYVKNEDYLFTVDKFGASAPRKAVLDKYGLTEEKIVQKIVELLK